MINTLLSKIKDTYKNEGISIVLKKIFTFPFRFAWRKFRVQKEWVFGKLFELLRKNRLIYKSAVFSFDNPYIQMKRKSRLLFGLGSYEEHPILFAEKYLSRNLPLIELGGCIGVTACITDKIIGNKHIVVEANPYIIPVLEKNKKVNGCNFSIVNKALGYKNNVDYYVSTNYVDGGLYKKTPQKISVQGITLQALAKGFKKINLIVDIEGSEVALIDNEINVISEKVSVLIIEFHPIIIGEIEVKRIISKLENADLHCIEKNGNDVVFINSDF